jgi:hypothetical protein
MTECVRLWNAGDVRQCSRVYGLLTHIPRERERERDTYLTEGDRSQKQTTLAIYRHTYAPPPPPFTRTGSQFGTKSLTQLDVSLFGPSTKYFHFFSRCFKSLRQLDVSLFTAQRVRARVSVRLLLGF